MANGRTKRLSVSEAAARTAAASAPDTSMHGKWSELPWYAWRERGSCVTFAACTAVPQWYCENEEFCYLLYVERPFVRIDILPFTERYWINTEYWYRSGGRITWEDLKAMAESLLARGRGKKPAKRKSGDELPKEFSKSYPILAAYMLDGKDEQGEDRERSKVSVFVDQDAIKASLSDPSNECTLFVTLDAPGSVWEALEARLSSGEADWRGWGGGKAKKFRGRGGR